MSDGLRKLLENFLPWLVEKTPIRFVLYGLFWLSTAFVTWWFVAQLRVPVPGALIALAPVALVWQTSRTGLSRVNGFLFGTVLFLAVLPVTTLGKAQAAKDNPTGFALVALVMFLVWCAAFPTMVNRVDRRFRLLHGGPEKDPKAEIRVMVMRIGAAFLIMAMTSEPVAAMMCYLALVSRVKWTAVLAGATCLVSPLLAITTDGLVWEADWIEVIAAVMSAYQWHVPIRNPEWRGGPIWREYLHPTSRPKTSSR